MIQFLIIILLFVAWVAFEALSIWAERRSDRKWRERRMRAGLGVPTWRTVR